MPQIQLYDTTLRDGAQTEGISFSVVDKLNIARKLNELGVHYIEGGWPGSNRKDEEFFERAQELQLTNSVLVAFGSTRRPHTKAQTDANLVALVNTGVQVVTIVGKSSALQVSQVLETSLEENLNMITDSIGYLKATGLTVFFDAEHFFDGFKTDRTYALRCLAAAEEAGAGCLVLCDTNGGTLPKEITTTVKAVKKATRIPLGIHAHNDSESAVANSLAALDAGATQIQGTINGYGERCGNANLVSILANLKLKMGIDCITDEQLTRLTEVAHFVSEAANLTPDPFLPFVGISAFSHKAGLHVYGVTKWADSYQHITPARVGNRQRSVVSELSGRGNIIYKAKELGVNLPPQGKEVQKLLERIKWLESRGFQYENAEASLETLLHRANPNYKPPFELVDFMVVVETRRRSPTRNSLVETLAEAIIKVKVGTETIHTAADGNGPVNALDQALRKALLQFYPGLAAVKLIDYKVRILEESTGTESQVRVLIESSDGVKEWRTVGSSANIIEASWLALADSLEYWLLKQRTPDKSPKK
ncbi:MAG: citramalate synthase [Dehalococcoidales bacterium]|nr:citramalate synthase [Dehalococcoidales bacterium]MDP6737532.1 citramalate synthase [Dehalococcoidales bacterium]